MKTAATLVLYLAALMFVGSAYGREYRMSANEPSVGTGQTQAASSIVDPPVPRVDPQTIIEPPLPDEPCFNYRYVEAGYVYRDFEPYFGDAGHGGGIGLSYDFLGPVYAAAKFRWSKADSKYSRSDASAGLGVYHEIYDCLHLTFEGGGRWGKTEYGHFSDSGFGYYAGPGFRAKFRSGIEIFGNAYYSGIDGDSGFLFDAGAVFDVTANLDLVISAVLEDDSQSYFAGFRLNY